MDKSFTLSLGLRAHQFFHGFESFYHKLSTNLTTNLPQQQLTINLVLLVQNLLHSTTKTYHISLRALPIFCATLNLPQNLTTNFHNSLQTYHKTYHVFIANFRDTRVKRSFRDSFYFQNFCIDVFQLNCIIVLILEPFILLLFAKLKGFTCNCYY